VGTRTGRPLCADGSTPAVANIIWCTDFDPGFEWIDLPVFTSDGEPMHCSAVVESDPGLYFVGIHFLHAASSAMIRGVGRDAARIVRVICPSAGVRGTLSRAAHTLSAGELP
jgi:putative flavoprotein involved in K+ transport